MHDAYGALSAWQNGSACTCVSATLGYGVQALRRSRSIGLCTRASLCLSNATHTRALHRAPPTGEKEQALGDVTKLLRILDTGLEDRPFLLGDDYTLADTHLHSVVHWVRMVGADLKPLPNVSAWVKRCDERPALKKLAESYSST